jgi:hypothetical protein
MKGEYMRLPMTNLTIEKITNRKKIIRTIKRLTETEEWFIESMSDYLEDFQCKKKYLGILKLYFWEKEPKTTIRMFLWRFDGNNGTDYLRRIFGDEPVPDFIIQDKAFSNKLCHAIICDPSNNSRDIDEEIILREKMLEKFEQ